MFKIKFNELTIENFGPYKGIHNINFSTDSIRNITLIKGLKIGTGKTSLIQCIRYIIYGIEDEDKLFGFVQRKMKKENNKFNLGGSLEFTLFDNEDLLGTYQIKRYFTYKNDKITNKTFEIYEDGEILTGESKESFKNKMENLIFNKGLQSFLFIQGEKLDDLFRTSIDDVMKGRNIKKFAEDLSDLPIIELFKKKLSMFNELAQKKLIEEQSDEKTLEEINKELDDKIGKKNETEIKIEENEKYFKEIEEKVNILISEIENFAQQAQDGEKLNSLSKELEKQKKIVENHTKERSKLMKKNLPFIYLEHAMKKCIEDLKDKEGKLWPKNIDKKTALALQKNPEFCEACGRKWDEESKHFLQNIINLIPVEYDNSLLINFRNKLKEIQSEIEQIKEELKVKEQSLRTERRELNRISENHKKLNALVDKKYSEESWLTSYRKKNEQKNKKEKQKKDLINELKELKYKLQKKDEKGKIVGGLIKEIDDLNIRKKGLESKIEKSYYWRPIITKVEFFQKLLEEVKNDFNEKLKSIIEENTLKVFKKLHWDSKIFEESKFKILEIDDGWEIEMEGVESTGETQLIGLSYIIGLSNAIEVKIPLFIDSPFVIYDITTKMNLGQSLPELMEGNQVILCVKDQELEHIEDLIDAKTEYSYRLEKIDRDESTIKVEKQEVII